ncbi:MAG: co-chaperone GroES [Phycisphaeraceae bacterium]|nr:MAG: co-chaperone GroES [Phycisphaeraceae bacterium]
MAKGTSAAIRPLGDKVLIKRDEAQTKTTSGLYLPETSKEKPMTATVEAVGTGRLNEESGARVPLSVKKGDRVLISKWGGTEVKLNEKEYLIISEEDILAVVED